MADLKIGHCIRTEETSILARDTSLWLDSILYAAEESPQAAAKMRRHDAETSGWTSY